MIKNNPLLIGYPGVGKTAIVKRIKQNQVPFYLKGKSLYDFLMAGANFQGDLEERLQIIFNFMTKSDNNAILFID
jgi:ATP-dependent Clp protease ATP-binding subunit ClpA